MATTVHVQYIYMCVCVLMYCRMGNKCEHPKNRNWDFSQTLDYTCTINITVPLHVYCTWTCYVAVQFAWRVQKYESSLLFQYHTLLTLEETGISNQEISAADKFVEKITQSSGGGP